MIWGFPEIGVFQNGWLIMVNKGNIHFKWMKWGYPYFRKPPYIYIQHYISPWLSAIAPSFPLENGRESNHQNRKKRCFINDCFTQILLHIMISLGNPDVKSAEIPRKSPGNHHDTQPSGSWPRTCFKSSWLINPVPWKSKKLKSSWRTSSPESPKLREDVDDIELHVMIMS